MPTVIQDEVVSAQVARSILARLKLTADANAVLSRPASRIPQLLVPTLVLVPWLYLQTIEQFQVPMWVSMLLVTVISALVMNLIDSFRISRRLEAAIILLQQQQESARQMGADS